MVYLAGSSLSVRDLSTPKKKSARLIGVIRDQYLPMLPSIAQTSLTVNESACRSQQASCPLPLPNMWTISGAYQVDKGPDTQSNLVNAASWDQDYAALLDMSGSGRHFRDRMTLHRNGDFADPVFLGHAMSISANYTVEYSDNAEYTVNAGFVSTLVAV